MSTATLTTKGQITIPIAIRASLGLETGSRIEFIEADNGQYLIMAATSPVQALKGLLRKPDSVVVSIEKMNEVITLRGAGLP